MQHMMWPSWMTLIDSHSEQRHGAVHVYYMLLEFCNMFLIFSTKCLRLLASHLGYTMVVHEWWITKLAPEQT